MNTSGDGIRFADEAGQGNREGNGGDLPAWKVLIADGDVMVHAALRLALAGARVAGYPLEFRDAYDSEQACQIMREEPDVAVVLMDLGMERERAGLEAAQFIRERLGNRRARIVLCTGDIEPALRAGTMQALDISDCWQKTELTARRLGVILRAAIGALQGQPYEDARKARTGTFQRAA